MNFDLSEDQEMFKSTVERFVAPIDVEARRKMRRTEGGYDRARWTQLAELGLIALAADEDAGGMGGSSVDLALVAEAMGRGNAIDPWLENGVLPARLLATAGSEALEDVLAGERFIACAFAERAQRYSLKPKAVTARAQGDGVVVRGEKTFVLGGGLADAFLVSTDMDGTIALLLVEADDPGAHARAYQLVDGSFACELQLNDARAVRLALDEDALLRVIADTRLFAGAEMVGLGQRLLDDTLDYVKQREQFGVSIGSFQAIQHRLVECYAALEQARSMLYRAALGDRDEIEAGRRTTAGAKAFISDQVGRIGREAVQMHGGMGITDELSIGHAVKRLLLLSSLFGDEAAMLAEYAEAA